MKKQSKKTETRVAETILQIPMDIAVGDNVYSVAPPSVATLILVSDIIARMDLGAMDSNRVAEEALRIARDCRPMGDVLATMILGAKAIREDAERCPRDGHKSLLSRFRRKNGESHPSAVETLSREILESMSPSQINQALVQVMQRMEVGDFFAITTFLNEVNLTKKTKVGD